MKSSDKLKSSFTIGDALIGTQYWQSETDSEFTFKLGKYISEYGPGAQKPRLSTPRSLKKGFVAFRDYEALAQLKIKADSDATMIKHQLHQADKTKEAWRGDEIHLIRSIDDEHQLQSKLTSQLQEALETLHKLQDATSRSKEFMRAVSSSHGLPIGDQHDTIHTTQSLLSEASLRITDTEMGRERKLIEMEGQIHSLGLKIQQKIQQSSRTRKTASRPASAHMATPKSPYHDRAESYKRRNDLELCRWRP